MTPERRSRSVVLAMGNDILGDDGVGLYAARALKKELGDEIDVVETAEAGLAIMEFLEGYERALILDAILTNDHPVGTIIEYETSQFRKIVGPSPHYAGLPEVLELAERLGIDFPREIRILAIEVEDPFTLREGLLPSVESALPTYIDKSLEILNQWRSEEPCMSTP